MDKFIFYFIASIILISALISVSAKNPIHSVLFLIVSVIFFIFLLVQLEAIFLAFIFLIVYVGAISVLFLFVVMMLNIKFVDLRRMILSSTTIGGILIFSSLLFIILSFYYYNDVVLLQNFNNFFYSFISANFVDLDWFFYVNKYENIKLIGSLIYTFFFIFFYFVWNYSINCYAWCYCTYNTKKTGRRQQNFYQIARSSYKALFFLNKMLDTKLNRVNLIKFRYIFLKSNKLVNEIVLKYILLKFLNLLTKNGNKVLADKIIRNLFLRIKLEGYNPLIFSL